MPPSGRLCGWPSLSSGRRWVPGRCRQFPSALDVDRIPRCPCWPPGSVPDRHACGGPDGMAPRHDPRTVHPAAAAVRGPAQREHGRASGGRGALQRMGTCTGLELRRRSPHRWTKCSVPEEFARPRYDRDPFFAFIWTFNPLVLGSSPSSLIDPHDIQSTARHRSGACGGAVGRSILSRDGFAVLSNLPIFWRVKGWYRRCRSTMRRGSFVDTVAAIGTVCARLQKRPRSPRLAGR